MKMLVAIAVIVLVAGASALESRSDIVGGVDAALGEFPYQVRLITTYSNSSRFGCGGTILSPTVVLTAAHCLVKKDLETVSVTVYAGMVDLNDKNKQVIHAAEYFSHELYNVPGGLVNDIALLKMAKPFHFDAHTSFASLPYQRQKLKGDCIATGYGALKENGTSSTKLQKVTVPIISDQECRTALPYYHIENSMLCAGYKQGGRDSCQGDSGGPLTCKGVVAGVTSFGDGCARPNTPSVYTEVSYYIRWIRNIMKSWNSKSYRNKEEMILQF